MSFTLQVSSVEQRIQQVTEETVERAVKPAVQTTPQFGLIVRICLFVFVFISPLSPCRPLPRCLRACPRKLLGDTRLDICCVGGQCF